MARRVALVLGLTGSMLVLGASAALACGGLVAPGHAEVLQKATTLAAWHQGYEHYVTGFQFAGSAAEFGYIIPLPGVPVKIEKGGDWTLERLEREVSPPIKFAEALAAFPAANKSVQVLQQVKVEALDITIVRGGGADVAAWADRNGFPLTTDAPKVLGAYSSSGAIFALAKFDRTAATTRGLIEGQGQTIHFVIPTRGPWIPLRILALGKVPTELVDADLFVLTDHRPAVAPSLAQIPGMTVRRSAWAGHSLLRDLRSDGGMAWVPHNMWLTALQLQAPARTVLHDLAIDGARSMAVASTARTRSATRWWALALAAAMTVAMLGIVRTLWRPARVRLEAA